MAKQQQDQHEAGRAPANRGPDADRETGVDTGDLDVTDTTDADADDAQLDRDAAERQDDDAADEHLGKGAARGADLDSDARGPLGAHDPGADANRHEGGSNPRKRVPRP